MSFPQNGEYLICELKRSLAPAQWVSVLLPSYMLPLLKPAFLFIISAFLFTVGSVAATKQSAEDKIQSLKQLVAETSDMLKKKPPKCACCFMVFFFSHS